ncbi:MAG: TIGR03960 family B12-binding radical SAM protein [Syntrophales bacterium]|nr:TIGR03960 family B12-binding radical SAM protein [Syntrophales bacterium]
MNWEEILLSVEKPSRYLGGEVNASRKDRQTCKLSFALVFPDTYEVGMSHLGLQILYAILNSLPTIAAERCYAPWPDMELQMRKNNILLSSLESRTPLNAFDVVGFSLQYELSYTNVLNMLDLGGIPLRGKNRKEEHPLVIAGGPCAFNPAPMSAFIDAFVIGEGEEVILEVAHAVVEGKEKGNKRQRIIAALAAIEGVYVPVVHTHGERIRKRVISDLDRWCFPVRPVVPLMKIIHDRANLEIARGCTRGCRFCQAGMVWRPVRERRPEVLLRMADEMLSRTGYDELSLLSLSSGDYTLIEPLLTTLMDCYCERRVALALPSLRVETLTRNLMENIKRVRKTSFTLAPEAGTQRLRNAINKGNTERDLLTTTGAVFEAGWRAIKLYFMLGLPGEEEEDLHGIVDLGYKVLREGENRRQVTVSLSTFVPKPHTPFQWERQIGLEETVGKQEFFKRCTRNLNIKWHDSRMSLLEGILTRGDERLGILIEKAFRLGCRFDGWGDQFKFDLWEAAIRESGINIEDYLRQRGLSESLPWDRIDCGVSREFLGKESQKSLHGELTADCRFGSCHDCGVCDHDTVCIVTAGYPSSVGGDVRLAGITREKRLNAGPEHSVPSEGKRFRIQFTKLGPSRFLSHLEVSGALIRALNQSDFSFIYSRGYHPHPKVSFAFATSVGMESMGEYADIWGEEPHAELDDLREKINARLPVGMRVVAMEEAPRGRALSELVRGFAYQIFLPEKFTASDLSAMAEKIEHFLQTETFTVVRETKGRSVIKNIRQFVDILILNRENYRLLMEVHLGEEGTVRPLDILRHVLGLNVDTARIIRILKTGTHFDNLY